MEVSNWLSCIRMILFISALEITPCLLFVVYWFSPVQTFFCNPLYCVDHQAPLTVGFSRQECWSGLPFPSPGYLPHPEILPTSPALPGGFFTTEPGGKPIACLYYLEKYKHKHLPGYILIFATFSVVTLTYQNSGTVPYVYTWATLSEKATLDF